MKTILTYIFLIFSTLSSHSQIKDSVNINNKNLIKPQKFFFSTGLIVSGILLNSNKDNSFKNKIKDWRNNEIPNFRTHIDDFIQFAPLASLYGFKMIGMKSKNNFKNQNIILIETQILTLGLTYGLKKYLNQTRPDGTSFSFPSGHTAEAFAGATIATIEYGENYKWVPYLAYGTATTVGIFRIANNKHYLSDVIFGAGLGILSAKIIYWINKKIN